jgi:accessory gene regulator B
MIELIISELSKVLIMFLIFGGFNSELAYLQCLITLLMIRSFTGGLHFETYAGCFIFSLIFFSLSIMSANALYLSSSLALTIYIVALVTIMLCSPTQSKNRPPLSKHKQLSANIISIVIITGLFLIYFVYPKCFVIKYSIWVVLYQTLQLIISKGVNYYEKKKETTC